VRTNKKWIIPAVILILSVAGLFLTAQKSSFDFTDVRFNYILAYIVILFMHYLISSLPTPIYIKDKRYFSSFLLHRLSLVSGYLFPLKIGLPMKVYFFNRYLGVPISKTSAAIFFEAVVHVFLITAGGILLGGTKYIFLDIRIVLLLCLVSVVLFFLLRKYLTLLTRFSWIKKIESFLINVKNSFKESLKNKSRVSLIIGLYIVMILLYVSRIGALLLAIDDPLPFIQVARAVLISSFITTLSMIPGGYAVREASLSFFLVQEGVPLEGTLIVAFLDRILSTGSSFFLGGISSLFVMKRSAAEE
jgi:uncharacterized protein (TIRG00374 family)